MVRYAQKLWIGDSLKDVVYLPFESNRMGKPALHSRREGHTDAQSTPR
jgi:hypothetical protein